MKYFRPLLFAVAAAVCLGGMPGISFADAPTVPDVPADAFPVMTLAQLIAPMTAVFPKLVGALMAVLVGSGIIWIIDFTWRRNRRHNK